MGPWRPGGWLSPCAQPLLLASSSGVLLSLEGSGGVLGTGQARVPSPSPSSPQMLRENFLAEARGPLGDRGSHSRWAGAAALSRHLKKPRQGTSHSVSSPCLAPILPTFWLHTKEWVGMRDTGWPGPPVGKGLTFGPVLLLWRALHSHRSPLMGLRKVSPCVT